ncbi:chromosome segregation protein SMC [Sporosalibacterium faouarense]|uniref:chromosome segregation protein SMC n=1 Tax=Sporosalibacterium faouarense TaxID=516123 RepID=UPI00192A70DA|nr:chromosome segregation protein SMC [Sporosalibacterium faouarense]
MYLKRIEVQGFKSFADKVDVQFEGGITGVVGPNGSGKSNISDAIRWVLGEQSAKTLRGSKMEDIIFSGTEKRKPLGYAEVTLVLDNKDNKLNIDYSEVSVTRRVFRSGDSEYYINKTACRLKDIKELFMDTGVGKDGYSIIGQGKIDEILSSKSEDRRNLFEEAAGIVKHKTRKEEAEKKLEKTKDNILRINDIIKELEMQIDPLREQSEKAKRFNELSEKLKDLEVNLYIREIDKLREQLQHLDNQKDVVNNQLKTNENRRDELEAKYSEGKSQIEEMDSKIEEIQNLKYSTQNKIEKNEGEIKLFNEKTSIIEKEMERIENEIKSLNLKIEDLNTERTSLQARKEEVSNKLTSLNNEIHEKSEKLLGLTREMEDKEKFIEDKKTNVIEILNMVADKKSRINSLNSFNQNIDKRVKQINDEIEELKTSEENNIKSLEKIDLEANNKIERLDELQRNKSVFEKNKSEKETMLKKTIQRVNILNGDIQGKLSNYRLLKDMKDEYEGFYSSVKNALKAAKNNSNLGKGVRGVVAELIQVDKKFERAIEVALGSSIQNIVTESSEDAKVMINYLKRNKLGRVTFLPMSSIKGRSINNYESKLLSSDGVLGVASELINYSQEYKNIFGSLLGRTVIVDNIDTGIKISKMCNYSLKIVSLDGDVMNPGGSMTGGSYRTNNTNLLGRERQIKELKSNISRLKEELDKERNSEETIRNEFQDIDSKILEASREINEIKVNLARLENQKSQTQEELNKIDKSIGKYNNERQQLTQESQESKDDIDSIQEEIEELKKEHEMAQGSIDSMIKTFEYERDTKSKLQDEITDLKVNAASLKQEVKSIEGSIDKVNEEVIDSKEKISDKHTEHQNSTNSLTEVKNRYQQLNKEKEALIEALSEYEEKVNEVKEQRTTFMKSFYEEQEKLKEMNRKINDLQKSLNIIDTKHAKYNVQLENYNNKLWDDYDMSYQMALGIKREIESISKVQNDIRSIKLDIRNLGNVNLGSIEEYKRVKERYEFLIEQKDDLINAKESLNKVIKDLETRMKQQFIEKFEIIKENFQGVFKELFGGGKADIILEDYDNILTSGIEIVAQPPGKKLQSLTLLSGGEKALTAIALLFAILKTKPTPFCVLDEIEAALDDANVYRFADYLKEFSVNTQFIVITHRKGTMESVDSLYGVTMEEKGVSRLISVKMTDKLIEKVS